MGLPGGDWPRCQNCGTSLVFLGQFESSDLIDLGAVGRILYLFECLAGPQTDCPTWSPAAGANAAFVLDKEEQSDALAAVPRDLPFVARQFEVVNWRQGEDLFDDQALADNMRSDWHAAVPERILDSATHETRAGGAPLWLQPPDDAPDPPFDFVMQLADFIETEHRRNEEWEANFGEGGLAYVFVDRGEIPQAVYFWQC